MRILFLTPAYPPFPGGGERYARALGMELVRRGHTLAVVTSGATREAAFWEGCTAGPEGSEAGVEVVPCPIAPFPGGRAGLLLWRKGMVVLSALPFRQRSAWLAAMGRRVPPVRDLDVTLNGLGPIDCVHAFNLSWEAPALSGQRFARARGLPFVVTPFAHLGAGIGDRVARNSTMRHQLELLSDADAVLTLTSVEAEGLARFGVPADRLAAIGCGLDPLPAEVPSVEEVFRRYDLKAPVILFVGRASYDKGAVHAAQAVLRLAGEGFQVQLVVAGQLSPEFQRFYRRLDLAASARIRPLGVIPEADKHALLTGCAALVLPSRTDSFGIVFLEAWAYGRPVIGARAGGIPGVIDDGQNGLLVPFGDVEALAQALEALLKDPSWARTLGARGLDKVNSVYSWEQVGARVWDRYQRLRR